MKRTVFALAITSICVSGQAAIWGFAAPVINGLQEVPPVFTNAYGTASFTVDDTTFRMEGSLNVWNIPTTRTTGAHLHVAPVGVNGPVRFDILGNQVAGSPVVSGNQVTYVFRGTLLDPVATFAALVAGNTYINVHSPQFPGGEIRGQVDCLGIIPEPASLAALGVGLAFLIRRKRK